MPNANAVVSNVIRLDPPLDRAPAELLRAERGLTVELEGGRRARLNPADERSAGFAVVLDGLRQQGLTAYLEIDPASAHITRLLIPYVTRVFSVRPIDPAGLDVELERSHARHLLRRQRPDFAELERALREAQHSGAVVAVTEDDGHDIIDVRPAAPGPDGPPPRLRRPKRLPLWRRWLGASLAWLRCWPFWPWGWFGCLSAAHAQQVFDAMLATSCAPLTVPAPCIPFLYPDDGCWGRAHEMCRLMIAMGLMPRKVWIQGKLRAGTRNNPSCSVAWGWHVAPTLWVCGPHWFQRRAMVVDPSLFTTPVSQSAWKGAQGDANASLTDSAAAIFYLWGSVTDPSYTQTLGVLATYRLRLQNRSISVGPPPYANCP